MGEKNQKEKFVLIDVLEISGETLRRPAGRPKLDEALRIMREVGITLTSGDFLTPKLMAWSGWHELDPAKTAMLFPEDGARQVQAQLFPFSTIGEEPNQFVTCTGLEEKQDQEAYHDWWGEGGKGLVALWLGTPQINIKAERTWVVGSAPTVEVGEVPSETRGSVRTVTDVIVIDDVISSGLTCSTVKARNQQFFPGARWHALCWMRQRASKLDGFSSIVAGVEVGGRKWKVPINSLSTLLRNNEIARSFAERNTDAPELFQEALHLIESERSFVHH